MMPFMPRLRRLPIVFSWHDPVPHSGDEDWPMHVTQRYLVGRSERVVVLTEAMRAMAVEAVPKAAAKIRVVHHGDFDSYLEGEEERPAQLDAEDRFILFFGRVSPYKGVEDLCEAFRMAGLGDYKLVIAGKHLYPVRVPSEALKGVVMMDQFISNQVLRYLFRRCALVVLPYRDATQSGVLMLAYAFGKAVLATRVGGIPEMMEEGVTGVTVAPQDPEAMATALREMLASPDRLERMGRGGLQHANENYSWGKIAGDHLRVYEEAIALKRGS
jgi:glycosyltransferase involved in cell wall biosynthesis